MGQRTAEPVVMASVWSMERTGLWQADCGRKPAELAQVRTRGFGVAGGVKRLIWVDDPAVVTCQGFSRDCIYKGVQCTWGSDAAGDASAVQSKAVNRRCCKRSAFLFHKPGRTAVFSYLVSVKPKMIPGSLWSFNELSMKVQASGWKTTARIHRLPSRQSRRSNTLAMRRTG